MNTERSRTRPTRY